MDASSRCELELPGFRFHPTEDELLQFYLKRTLLGTEFCDVIGFLNIYNYDPWDLPELAKIGEREWYFFVARDKKHGSGGRPNRTTQHGFWKATGSDRQIMNTSYPKTLLGLKKTLVYYEGRAPRGSKTDWIMNEYRLPDKSSHLKDIVLCKIYRKATSLKVLEHRAATMEEETCKNVGSNRSPTWDSISFCSDQSEEANMSSSITDTNTDTNANTSTGFVNKEVNRQQDVKGEDSAAVRSCSSLVLPSNGSLNFAELQLPSLDWTQDSFWTLFSPCIDNFASFLPMC